jgi:DNA-binding SARP family transcriptional activator
VYLLGRFEVVRGGVPILQQAWRRRRPADLLKLMALTPGRTLDRDAAIALLWPDKDPTSGANNLHRALYDLRQILGARWVDLERGRIRLAPEVWLDVDAFEAAARSEDPQAREAAVSLYRGDLSPEDRDSGWLARHRERLRTLMADAALPVARAAAERGDAAVAVPLLRRLVDVDSIDEEPHRLLVRILAESGRRAEALRQYEACEAGSN